jgi:hypothetical protein
LIAFFDAKIFHETINSNLTERLQLKSDVYVAQIRVVDSGDDPDLFELVSHLEQFAEPNGFHMPYWQTKVGNAYFGGRECPVAIVLLTPGSLHGLKLHDITQAECRVLHARLMSGDELDVQRKNEVEVFPWERNSKVALAAYGNKR